MLRLFKQKKTKQKKNPPKADTNKLFKDTSASLLCGRGEALKKRDNDASHTEAQRRVTGLHPSTQI